MDSKKDRMMLANPAEDFAAVTVCALVCVYVRMCVCVWLGESHIWAVLIPQSGLVLSM